MSTKKNSKGERGYTQVGLPIEHHNALEEIASSRGSTRCGVIKAEITPLILKRIALKKKK